MKLIILVCCCLFFQFSSLSQIISIKDSTGRSVPYATIEIMKRKAAYFCNEEGVIDLGSLAIENTDTLIISSIGYRSKRMARNLIDQSVVLTAYSRQMPEAFVYDGNWRSAALLKRKKATQGFTGPVELLKGPGEQVARIIYPDKHANGPVFLEKISFLFGNAANSRAPVRLRIYEVEEDLMPGADILTRSLVTKMESEDGWLDFDLIEDAIRIEEKGIIVAVEFFDTDSTYWHKDPNWMRVDSAGNPERYTEKVLGGYFILNDYQDDCRSYKRINGEWVRLENRMLIKPYECYNLVTAVVVRYPAK